jgi:CubicO group peptidase (beta-lactamase class C family)
MKKLWLLIWLHRVLLLLIGLHGVLAPPADEPFGAVQDDRTKEVDESTAQIEPSLEKLKAQLETSLPNLLNKNDVDGVSIGIVYGGKTALLRAWGQACYNAGAAFTPDTVVQQGSTSKAVMAWAVMNLVEKGVLGLDDPIGPHLKTWKIPSDNPSWSDGVTVRRLLSHTAGIGLPGLSGFISHLPPTTLALDAQKDRCCLVKHTWAPGKGDTRVKYEPGAGWHCSTGGYHQGECC